MLYDGDNGATALARGRALGIHGLVFPLKGDAGRNQAPVTNAGANFTVEQHRQVQLTGSRTDDGLTTGAAKGNAHTDWSKRSGPGEVVFGDSGQVNTHAMFTEPGTYILRMTASDGLREAYDDVTVTVLAASNRAPIVSAGTSVVLNDSNRYALRGTASDDGNPLGQLQTRWSMVSGPATVSFSDPASLTTNVTFTSKGTYVLELRADDGELVTTDRITLVVNHAMPTSPLLAYLQMNDLHTPDSSQHGLHGEASAVALTSGKFGNAIQFSGSSHVAMPRTEFLQPKAGLTAALWIRPSVTDGVLRPVLVWDGGSWDAYKITLANGTSSAKVNASVASNGNKGVSLTTAPFPTDRWTHLALTYSGRDGGEVRLYRDGALIGSMGGVGSALSYQGNSANRLTLGKEHPTATSPGFIGAMDDLYVYDYALAADEIGHLMMGHAPYTQSAVSPLVTHDMHLMAVMNDGFTEQPLLSSERIATNSEPLPDLNAVTVIGNQSYIDADYGGLLKTPAEVPEIELEPSAWSANIDAALAACLETDHWHSLD
jgi:hypothetical protein